MYSINTVGRVPNKNEMKEKLKKFTELAKTIEKQNAKASSVGQLFTAQALDLRKQLLNESKLLFRHSPVEYGKFVEDIVWKRVYYDFVRFLKVSKQNSRTQLHRFHLISGIGHYNSLLLSFYKVFNFKPIENIVKFVPYHWASVNKEEDGDDADDVVIDDINFFNDGDSESSITFSISNKKAYNEAMSHLIQRFCICIGDLSRYYFDYFGDKTRKDDHYFKMSEFYYKAAWIVEPSNGMPFNQLGTLYSHDYLVANYYFFRSLISKKPFSGVVTNMAQNISMADRLAVLNPAGKSVQLFVQFLGKLFNLSKSTKEEVNLEYSYEDILISMEQGLSALNIALAQEQPELTIQQIFYMNSLIIMLISWTRTHMEREDIELKLLSKEDKASNQLAYNFNLSITFAYRFFFLFNALIMNTVTKTIEKYEATFPVLNVDAVEDRKVAFRRLISMSHECNDPPEDINSLNQLKSTAFDSIFNLLESDNEADQQEDSSHEDDTLDVIDKMIYEDPEDKQPSAARPTRGKGKKFRKDKKVQQTANVVEPEIVEDLPRVSKKPKDQDVQHFEDILSDIYTKTYTPAIKFFCDYLQADRNIYKLLTTLDTVTDLFEAFIKLANAMARVDFNLITSCPKLKSKLKGSLKNSSYSNFRDLISLIKECSAKPVNTVLYTRPLSSELDYIDLTSELSISYATTFGLSPDELPAFHQFDQRNRCITTAKSGYICIRTIVNFTAKLLLINLDSAYFGLSKQNFSPETVHDFPNALPVTFGFHRKQIETQVHIVSKPVVTSASTTDGNSDSQCRRASPTWNMRTCYPKVEAFSQFVLIDPYFYITNLADIQNLVGTRHIHLIVPKMVLDFLKNTKDELPDAEMALKYLTDAYLSANRNIRFVNTDNRLEVEGLESVPYQWPRGLETKDTKQDPNNERLRMLARHRELMEIANYLIVNKVIGRADEFEYMDTETGQYIRKKVEKSTITIISNIVDWNQNFISAAKCNSMTVMSMSMFIHHVYTSMRIYCDAQEVSGKSAPKSPSPVRKPKGKPKGPRNFQDQRFNNAIRRPSRKTPVFIPIPSNK